MDRHQMHVDLLEGRFLNMLVRHSGARNILEIGMFTGYSAPMMSEALPENGHVTTCEINPKAEAIARKYFAESPHGNKITIRMGRALETIKTLSGPFDLVFIDADKPNYCNYYEATFPLVRPGGLIVGDNVLWSGKVLDSKETKVRESVIYVLKKCKRGVPFRAKVWSTAQRLVMLGYILKTTTEENYASLNLVHSCWTDRGGDCEIGHACAHDYFLDHRARHHRIDHRRRSHSHVFTTGQCAIPSGWSHFFHPGSDSGSLRLL